VKTLLKWCGRAMVVVIALFAFTFLVFLFIGILDAVDVMKNSVCTQRTCSQGSHAVFTQAGCLCEPLAPTDRD